MKLIVICGATATGKSDLAVAVAKEIDAQVINADSMQLYKGMDIGTAKLTITERNGVEHHLIDVLDIKDDANVAWYQNLARNKIDDVIAAGQSVVVVGGTGLYIKSILDDLNFPDTRRIIRALEVIELTGKPFTANLPREESSRYPNAQQFGLALDRDNLDNKIDERVESMWAKGFAREVSLLMTQGLEQATTAKKALGYSQLMDYLNGECSEDFAKEETKRTTKAYARRQQTWFARDSRINWLEQASTSARLEKLLASIN